MFDAKQEESSGGSRGGAGAARTGALSAAADGNDAGIVLYSGAGAPTPNPPTTKTTRQSLTPKQLVTQKTPSRYTLN